MGPEYLQKQLSSAILRNIKETTWPILDTLLFLLGGFL
jgi:hypothetical protein